MSGKNTAPSQGLTSHLSWRAPHLLRSRDSLWGFRGNVQHALHFITVDGAASTALAMRLPSCLQPDRSLTPPCCPLCLLLLSAETAAHPHKGSESGERPSLSATAHPPLQGVAVTAEQRHYTTVHSGQGGGARHKVLQNHRETEGRTRKQFPVLNWAGRGAGNSFSSFCGNCFSHPTVSLPSPGGDTKDEGHDFPQVPSWHEA